jgi:hypothetical protein
MIHLDNIYAFFYIKIETLQIFHDLNFQEQSKVAQASIFDCDLCTENVSALFAVHKILKLFRDF